MKKVRAIQRRQFLGSSFLRLSSLALITSAPFHPICFKFAAVRRQKTAMQALAKLGCTADFEWVGALSWINRWARRLGFDGPIIASCANDSQTLTDADLAYYAGMPDLIKLGLENTRVTDSGLEHLRRLANMRFLYLNNTQITDAGLIHLRKMKQLVLLRIGGTEITEDGIEQFKQWLPDCAIMR